MADYNIDTLLQTIFDSTECNTWKPSDKIQLINKELEKLKGDTRDFLSNANYDISAIVTESNELCAESGALLQEMEACREEIEGETIADILQAIDKQNQLTKELQTVNFAINLIYDVVTCGNYVKEFESGRVDKSFNRACESVYDLLQFLENPAEGFTSLDIYNTTKQNAQLILESLLRDLYTLWDRMIAYKIKSGSKKTEVTITFNMDERLVVVDALNALCKCKRLMEKVKHVSQFLLKDVLEPIIHFDCTVYAETDDQVSITINHKQKNPPYDNVIANLRILFHFLSNKLNVDFDYHMTLMTLIGETVAVEFIDILVKDCLLDTIPNNLNDLQTYGKITAEIEDFQRFLSMVKFFYKDKYSLLAYMKDIDILFANKSSQYFLETARAIMLKDLSVTMSIGVESIPEDQETPSTSKLDKSTEEALKVFDETLPKSLFYFPRCMISKTAQELLDLVYVMMEQAVQCSDVVSKKLYNTTRLVFELYDAVVPYHHENYLQTIPQYVALFHNNCMFLAHHLQTFGDKWLILMEGRRMQYPVSFVDHVQQLRALAHTHLAAHMRQQRAQILDNIRSSDLNNMAMKDVLGDDAEAAIRQSLRQLQLLKNVCIGVLPYNVFTRLMATLVNMFVEELIHRVCTVEDISMEMATQLTDMYTLVVQKAPQLFQKPIDVEEHVKSWIKLQELIFVLGGSLKDIDNHWNDGKGPLGVHFKTEELRSLIKALFQNTQFRANLLSKIK
ncbi:centromere/kinetochore protein zw10 homolog isoform X2 [Cydia strobilella]|uniref:centromere/kinetochore protein zw10 homolog isoform X2 n=1 Tax=Cydia strobilella TaxID=1100964 RepID=UPI00300608A1